MALAYHAEARSFGDLDPGDLALRKVRSSPPQSTTGWGPVADAGDWAPDAMPIWGMPERH